jgi:hypothetical protein
MLEIEAVVATPSVLVLIPVELEKKLVLLRPIVVVAPAVSVVNTPTSPPILLVLMLEMEAVVATPSVLVLIPVELEK